MVRKVFKMVTLNYQGIGEDSKASSPSQGCAGGLPRLDAKCAHQATLSHPPSQLNRGEKNKMENNS